MPALKMHWSRWSKGRCECDRYAIEESCAGYELLDGEVLVDIFPTLREAKTYAKGMAYLVREGLSKSA